ncbi:amino acid transporter [Gryllotalpicola protaetiae]|uniref:Amino acid transporter n=1 Tax=Gryllotalpicola protaetiae TaxID=2419771 RepID=A0A387BHT6_9MICO|nr:amino acid transporter [Gryllotalpicola protaetiae]
MRFFSWHDGLRIPNVGVVSPSSTLLPALLGLGTGLSLIVAIGAQNAYLLRLGVVATRRVMLPVVLLCAVSDAVLISAGTAGVGAVIQRAPEVLVVVRVIGAGFLMVYGFLAARRAVRPNGETLTVTTGAEGRGVRLGTAIATVSALTWLNPHVYLDAVVFLGSIANQQAPDARWWWVGGAVTASFVWFFSLGFGARLLRPLFARPMSWRVLDALIAVIMVSLGVKLLLGS